MTKYHVIRALTPCVVSRSVSRCYLNTLSRNINQKKAVCGIYSYLLMCRLLSVKHEVIHAEFVSAVVLIFIW